jgi:hypothetical protein
MNDGVDADRAEIGAIPSFRRRSGVARPGLGQAEQTLDQYDPESPPQEGPLILMFAGVFYSREEGSDLRTWDQRRMAKRLFYAGATSALVVPVVGYLVGLRERRACGAKKPASWNDLD